MIRLTILFMVPIILGVVCARYVLQEINLARVVHEEKVKACNRGGAIYADGVCQHPFAPICRRTLDCPPYPRRL